MIRKYEIYSGRRVVSTQYSVSPTQAVLDYVRSYGVKADEIRRLGVDSVSGAALSSGRCSSLRRTSRSPSARHREDAERFIEKVRGDDPELASYLRIEEGEAPDGTV
jgi:hypothetical protein